MKARVRRAINFVTSDIWRIRTRELPRSKFWLIRQLQIIVLALRGFSRDKCSLRASALTYHTILAVVPGIAVAFGVAKGFGLERILEERLTKALSGYEEIAAKLIQFSHSLLETAKGGVIAGVGVALLFWTVINVLSQIEKSFNDIWGIKTPRSLPRKFADYLSMMLICPILIVASGSATVLVAGKIGLAIETSSIVGFFRPLIMPALRLLPYCIGWGLFAFVYIFMPNTKVNFSSALLGGVVAGTLYQLAQWVYISFQFGVTRYSAIYGSFAALPLFLIWLQTSWLVVLFGAELSFAQQNVETYEFEPDSLKVSRYFKNLVALMMTHLFVKNFAEGKPAATAAQVSHRLGVPIRLANEVLFELTDAGVLSETSCQDHKDVAYQPARDIKELTIGYVLHSLQQRGSDNIPLVPSEVLENLQGRLRHFHEAIKGLPDNVPLRDL